MHVNDSLWRDCVDEPKQFTRKFLDIKAYIGGADAIQKLCYQEDVPFTGVWNGYLDCVESRGQIQSRLSDIGQALFPGCSTYADALRYTGADYFSRAVKAISGKDELLEAIRSTDNLGFTEGGQEANPVQRANNVGIQFVDDAANYADEMISGSGNKDQDEKKGDPRRSERIAARKASQAHGFRSHHQRRRHDDDDDDEDEDMEPAPSRKRRSRDDDDEDGDEDDYDETETQARRPRRGGGGGGPRTPMHNAFMGYLGAQPAAKRAHGAAMSLRQRYEDVLEEIGDAGKDHSLEAWQRLSGALVDNQLFHNVREMHRTDQAGHTWPRTALERWAAKAGDWSNEDQDDVQSLTTNDFGSVRWVPVEDRDDEKPMVYLDAQLEVVGVLRQASAALTLSSVHTTLFALADDAFRQLETRKGVALMDKSGVADSDLSVRNGARRFAALQHSVNVSAAFYAVADALKNLDKPKDVRWLLHAPDASRATSEDAAKLLASLRSHIDSDTPPPFCKVDKEGYRKMMSAVSKRQGVAAIQLPLEQCVEACNKIARQFYAHPGTGGTDAQLLASASALIHYLSNPLAHSGGGGGAEEDGDESRGGSSSTSARRPMVDAETSDEHAAGNRRAVFGAEADDTTRAMVMRAVDQAERKRGATFSRLDATHSENTRLRTGKGTAFYPMRKPFNVLHPDNLDEWAAIYKQLTLVDMLEDTDASKLLEAIIYTASLIYAQESGRFGKNVAVMDVYNRFILSQYAEPYSAGTLPIYLDEMAKDDAVLASANGTDAALVFPSVSRLDKIIKHAQQRIGTRRSVIQAFGAKDWKAKFEKIDFAPPQVKRDRAARRYAGSASLIHVPRNWTYGQLGSIHTAFVVAKDLMESGNVNAGTLINNITASNLVKYVVLAVFTGQNNASQAAFSTMFDTTLPGITPDQKEAAKAWARTPGDFSYYLANGGAPVSSSEVSAEAGSAVSRLLEAVSLDDCRLHDLMVRYNCEPLIGLIYAWPNIRFRAGHMAMVRDGEVGSVPYITPDNLLSEDGRQKMVYYHMSMYFTPMVKNHRALHTALFVSSTDYIDGWQRSWVDPMNPEHIANIKSNIVYDQCAFVIPTLINHRVRAIAMSLTGEFADTVNVSPSQLKTTEYAVADVLAERYGWDSNQPSSFDPRSFVREQASFQRRASNCLVFQGHQQSFDPNTNKWTRLLVNRGHLGRHIYDGVMNVFDKGELIKDRVGDADLQTNATSLA